MLIFPKALKFLPTSGKWMNNLKLILATSLIGTIIWLLYILEAQINLRAVQGVDKIVAITPLK